VEKLVVLRRSIAEPAGFHIVAPICHGTNSRSP
jgi:hypothetical protein